MKRYWFMIAVAAFIALMLFAKQLMIQSTSTRLATYWTMSAPFSADPMDYDAFAHHETFRSVLAGLVTQYKVGQYTGILSDKWRVSDDRQEWRFHIRPDVYFENGDRITPEHIVKSLTRTAYLLRKKGSRSDVFDALVEHERINSPRGAFAGLNHTEEEVIARFTLPQPKLLEKLSFGLYSVVHPNDYDPHTGKWKDPRSVTASYAYRVGKWDADEFILIRRGDFLPSLFHPRPLKEVHYKWGTSRLSGADLISADSTISPPGEEYSYYGKTPARIAYVHCLAWKDPKSPLHSREFRRQLRDRFYQFLEKDGTTITRSFFPLAMQGIHEFASSQTSSQSPAGQFPPLKFRLLDSLNQYFKSYERWLPAAIRYVGVEALGMQVGVGTLMNDLDPDKADHDLDIAALGTGILIEDPIADIRFMIETKSGIRLPDEDGSITEELKKVDFSPQNINELLWEQAIIWPLGHYSSGLWAKADLDLSQLNHVLPPIELPWVGWKD